MTERLTQFVIALALLVLPGCSSRMSRVSAAFLRYEASLVLTADVPASGIALKMPVPIRLMLRNRGNGTVSGCVGFANEFLFSGTGGGVGGTATLIDHPSCKVRFLLEPGEVVSWDDEAPLGNYMKPGAAELRVRVELVYPEECGQYGCYATWIEAEPVALTVEEDASSMDGTTSDRL